MNKVFRWFENQAFGVCQKLGDKLGINPTKIRLYFVYLSFFTAGSPIILYSFLAFLMETRALFIRPRNRKKTLWDL